ncbi:helix-turn-helix domain-containing protein [Streptomyces lavendofoliae]|uniref:nSTAND1 domain-containing NTPase n=1 Tax=Streptomyces lavendofoliae TaxID=67314 RepID=UPI003D8A8342
MGRPERVVDPNEGPVQRFAFELRKLRHDAGGLTYREMARKAHYSVTALSQAAAGELMPSLAVALAYVKACGGDLEEWERRWKETSQESASWKPEDETGPAPYQGLARFEPDDHHRFFGRDKLVAELRRMVTEHHFSAVFGPSGSGKSSLLRAGLIPALRDHSAGQVAALRILTPGEHPLRTHASALRAKDAKGDTVIVVDQFEELFTLCRDAAQRAEFIDRLVAAREPGSHMRVVIAVRADFYGRLADHRALAEAVSASSLLVGPMNATELREAIVKPAQGAGLIVERELTSRLVKEVDGEPGGLPLLSHALRETWHRRRGRALTTDMYQAAGGLHGAISQTAEEIYALLTPHHAELVRLILLRLIAPGEGAQDTRRPVARSELDFVTASQDDIALVLDRLARARLLTLDEDGVDLAHEALILGWPRLRGWVEETREQLRAHRRLTEAARAWEDLGRDPGALYRGARLAAAEEVFTAPHADRDLNCLEQQFLTSSLTARDHERRTAARTARRLRRLTSALSVLLVLAVTAGLIAWDQYRASEHRRHQAVAAQQTALSRQLATQSATLLRDDPDLAALLAVQAYRTRPTAEATASLNVAAALPLRQLLTGPTGPVNAVAFSPDGRAVAAGSSGGEVRLWDTATGTARKAPPAPGTGAAASIALSPDGRLLAVGNTDGTLRLSNLHEGHTGWITMEHPGDLGPVAFSPDGRTVAAGSSGGQVRLWDTATGAARKVTPALGKVLSLIALSPDGLLLAAGDTGGTIHLYDLIRDTTQVIRPAGLGSLTSMAFSPDGRMLAVGGLTGPVIALWDTKKRVLSTRSTTHIGSVRAISFSPDGRTVATVGDDRTARVWESTTGRDHVVLTGHADFVTSVAFSPDGSTLATGSRDRTVRLWDLARELPDSTQPGSTTVASIAYAADGHTTGTGDHNGTVQTWRTVGKQPRSIRTVGNGTVMSTVLASDGRVLAAALTSSDGRTVRVWEAARRGLRTIGQHHPQSDTVLAAALSRDGRLLATGGTGGTVQLWDVADGSSRTVLDATDMVVSLAFSHDGHTLVSAGADGKVRLWVTASRTTSAILTDMASSLALSSDGRTLATGHDDGTVRIWDLTTRTVRATLKGRQRSVTALAISPNQRTLVAASSDGALQRWVLSLPSPGQAIDTICHALHRDLTPQERSQYLPDHPRSRVCAGQALTPRSRARS